MGASFKLGPPVGGGWMDKYFPHVALFTGSIMGGAALGLVLAATSMGAAIAPSTRLGALIAVPSLSVAAAFWAPLHRALPDRSRQLKESLVLEVPRWRAALVWGLDLGSAVRTLAVTPLLYAFLAIAALQPAPQLSLALAVLYGGSRAGSVTILSLKRSQPPRSPLPTIASRLRAASAFTVALAVAALIQMEN